MIKGLVSVVIPVYNDCRFLAETIESVLAQTYRDFEIVLVDDGSADPAPIEAVIRPYRADNFRYVRNEKNIGLAASRNVGIRHSKGEFICFLDADDILTPRKFEVQTGILNARPEMQMVFSDEYAIRDGVRIEVPQQFPNGYTAGERPVETFVRASFIAVFTVMVRAASLEKIGIFNEFLRWNEDDDLWFRMMLAGEVAYSEYVSGYRRLHDQNMSLNRSKMMFYQLKTFSGWTTQCRKFRRPDLKKIIKKRTMPLAKTYFKTTLRKGKLDREALSYLFTIVMS